MPPHDDDLLVRQCQQGSQGAFSEIVRRHQDSVYSICVRMVGRPTEAEDLAQETFLRLYRSLDRFRPGARLRPWLHKIAMNLCLDALRKVKGATLSLDEPGEGPYEPRTPDRDAYPEDAALRRERRLDVQEALLRLPGDYRAPLVLRYLGECSYQEIAETLGVPVSTVETRLFRGKKMLGQIMNPPVEGEGRENALLLEGDRGVSLR